ncbi:MAG TPA: uracil phosphoribosyltransferase, partial [Nitrolancea sp.]|nr:uracil phosphoribosyltransferase [Nitrolancea sp.]
LEGEEVERIDVPGFSGDPIDGTRLRRQPALLAIMRAGLGMVPPVRALLPNISVYQIGIKRNERTLEPNVYYSNLPESYDGIGHLLILDPMLATGGSACLALHEARKHFAGEVTFLGLLGAPFGVERLLRADPHARIVLAALDERLDDRGYILPGLGDAGDRLFGT